MGNGTEDPGPWPVDVAAGRLKMAADRLRDLADTYSAADPSDTSEDERQRLTEAARLADRALDLFQ